MHQKVKEDYMTTQEYIELHSTMQQSINDQVKQENGDLK